MLKRVDQKNQTKRKLIEVALKLSAEKSFSALSLREIAGGAGLTPAGFYRHFRDMEDLGLALLDEVGLSLRRLLRETRNRISPGPHAIKSSIDTFLDFLNENGNHFRLLLGERQGATPAFRKAIHSELDLFIAELTEDLGREYQKIGRKFRHPALTAEAIVAVVFTIGAEALDLTKQKQMGLAIRLVEEVKMILRGSFEEEKSHALKKHKTKTRI